MIDRQWSLYHILMLLFFGYFLSACASIMHGTKQEIGIASTPAGATAKIDGIQAITPAKITLERDKSYNITFEKEGYETASSTIQKEASGWLWGNLIFGGLIGLIVDFANGGAYDLVPENVHVTLPPKATTATPKPEAPPEAPKEQPPGVDVPKK